MSRDTRIRIVVAEDRPIARKVLCDELDAEPDLEIVALARDGDACIALVREHEPDLVLCDIDMPKRNGIDTIRALRTFTNVPVLVLTGARVAASELEFVAMRAGANGFLVKPSGPVSVDLYMIRTELVRTIRKLVQQHQPRARPKRAPRPATSIR